jgi:prepilin-type N-terminal cleavage/methylation domain-containing protein
MRRRYPGRGFTLIEVLVVVAIIGLLATIAIANYLTGLQKARQKRTMADIRSIAVAWESRAVETRQYNAAGQTPTPTAYNLPSTTLTYAQLTGILSPTFIRTMPRIDGWSTAFEFAVDNPIGAAASSAYAIRSAGSDGKFDASYVEGPTDDFECDIVYGEGRFIVYPRVK